MTTTVAPNIPKPETYLSGPIGSARPKGAVARWDLLGSVAFGVSAVAGYISPATGQLRDAERSNLGTFVGALCFLAGALLLLPERTEDGG